MKRNGNDHVESRSIGKTFIQKQLRNTGKDSIFNLTFLDIAFAEMIHGSVSNEDNKLKHCLKEK